MITRFPAAINDNYALEAGFSPTPIFPVGEKR
jgi:hypothetical protein